MTDKLSDRDRRVKPIVRKWANQMRPFAESHPNPEWSSRGRDPTEETYNQEGTKVEFLNLGDFGMVAHLDGGKYRGRGVDQKSGFVYARQVSLYGDDNLGEDVRLASHLLNPISDWAKEVGLGATVIAKDNYQISVHTPTIFLRGELPAEMFPEYINLVRQVEYHIDVGLKKADREVERPFQYVLFDHPTSQNSVAIKPFENLADLESARKIFVSGKELPREDRVMIHSFREFEDGGESSIKRLGKLLSVEDFLGIKKADGR